jgi:hypothetical protein
MPIHYEFPAMKENPEDDSINNGEERLRTGRRRRGSNEGDFEDDRTRGMPASVSARRDLVTKYWSTKSGKAQIMTSATLIGAGLGRFLGKVR